MNKDVKHLCENEVPWLIGELLLPDVPYWRFNDLRSRAAFALRVLREAVLKERTYRSRYDLDFYQARLCREEEIKPFIKEKLLAKMFDTIFDHEDLYTFSMEKLEDGTVRYELSFSINPPEESKWIKS